MSDAEYEAYMNVSYNKNAILNLSDFKDQADLLNDLLDGASLYTLNQVYDILTTASLKKECEL